MRCRTRPSESPPFTRGSGRRRCPRIRTYHSISGKGRTLRSWPIARRSLGRPEKASTFTGPHRPRQAGTARRGVELPHRRRPAHGADMGQDEGGGWPCRRFGNHCESAVDRTVAGMSTRDPCSNCRREEARGVSLAAVDADPDSEDGLRPSVDGGKRRRRGDLQLIPSPFPFRLFFPFFFLFFFLFFFFFFFPFFFFFLPFWAGGRGLRIRRSRWRSRRRGNTSMAPKSGRLGLGYRCSRIRRAGRGGLRRRGVRRYRG